MKAKRHIPSLSIPRASAICIGLLLALNIGYTQAEIVFTDDFSSGARSPSKNGFSWTDHSRNVYVDEDPVTGLPTIPYSDEYSLGFTHRAKSDGQDSTSEQRFAFDRAYPELWFSYYVRVPDNFYHRTQSSSANNKWLALWTDKYESDGVTVVLEYWPDSDGSSRIAYRWVRNGDRAPGHQGHTLFIVNPDDRGKWMHFVFHVKLASGMGVDDGVVQTWVKKQGESSYKAVHHRTDAPLYADGATNGFNTGYLMGWSNSGFSEETSFYIDDFTVSTTSLLGAAPNPPDAFSVE